MADQERGFYLLILSPEGPSLVDRACVVRGGGIERFGSESDVLGTLDQAEPAEAVAYAGSLYDLHGARVVRSRVRCDGVDIDVVVLRPDGPLPPVTESEIRTWLAVALVASGLELTTGALGGFGTQTEGTNVSVGELIGSSDPGWQRRLPAIGALFLGLLLGVWLGFGAGGGDEAQGGTAAVSGLASPAQAPAAKAPAAKAPAAKAPTAETPAANPEGSAAAVRAPAYEDPDLGAEPDARTESQGDRAAATAAVDPPGDAPVAPATAQPTAASRGAIHGGAAVVTAAPVSAKLASGSAALRPLPAVSLWNGGPTPSGVMARCNPYGDLVLTVGKGRRAIRRVIVCGRFRAYGALGMMRSAVCIPAQHRCARTAEAATTNKRRARAARLRVTHLPAYVCTPISGRPYGLRRFGRKLRYRNGLAQLGMKTYGGVRLASRCGHRAPYVSRLPRLKRTPVISAKRGASRARSRRVRSARRRSSHHVNRPAPRSARPHASTHAPTKPSSVDRLRAKAVTAPRRAPRPAPSATAEPLGPPEM